MNELETMLKDNELPEIPASLRRAPPGVAEALPDTPIEIERQFVTVEEEGGIPVTHQE